MPSKEGREIPQLAAPRSRGLFECVPCKEGLSCPFGSDLQSLRSGRAVLGEEYVPEVMEGYYSEQEEPLVIYKCNLCCTKNSQEAKQIEQFF